MKKAFISVFTVILTITLMLSAVLPVSATETAHQNYEDYFWQKLGQYREEMSEKYEDFALTDYFYYKELFRYYSGDEGATPDFVLVDATYYYNAPPHAYRYRFGEYIYDSSELGDKCFIYLPEEDIVYTPEEAYYNRLDGLEEAFAQVYSLALGKIGDVDGDMEVNIKDATYLQKYIAKLIECGNSNPYVNANPQLFNKVCDVNADHTINIKDATMIQKQLAKLLIPTVYDKTPASVDSVEYIEVDLGNNADFGNSDKLITNISQWNAYPHSSDKQYTEEFFEEKSLVRIYRTYYSGMVNGFIDGVYKEGNTLYVKYREVHPSGGAVTDDIGVFNTAIEIDKDLLSGVEKLVIDQNRYYQQPYEN